MKPATKEAVKLMHEGTLALAKVEADGIRIDTAYLDKTIDKVSGRIKSLTERLKSDDVYATWRRRFGQSMRLGSRPQLAEVLFDEMGINCDKRTATGRAAADISVLDTIDLPFVKSYLEIERLKKLRSTYLTGLSHEVVDGYVHPFFNLHLIPTYRSSSDRPNYQNQPNRVPLAAKLVRRAFIPRPNHVMVEIDYGALEFRVAACHWRDDSMIAYASDSSLDIHRDMAAECYLLPIDKVPKMARFYAKNQFVFPELYGSYYVNCAANLWQHAASVKTLEGLPLRDHLKSEGINGPKQFESHIEQVEQRFNNRFPQWAERKEQWWNRYQRNGWFSTMTGFVCSGVFNRKDLMNWPIQGPAFHLTLWSLIRLVRWLTKHKMRSVVIGEIHDAITLDVHKDEFDDVIGMAVEIMTVAVRKAWSWVIVPLEIEIEVAYDNWWAKKEYVLA